MSLTDDEILCQVQALATASKVRWTLHVEERMAERGFDKSQIKSCLKQGAFTELPVIANRSGPLQYKFTMESNVEGQAIGVAASLIPEERIVVITVFDPA